MTINKTVQENFIMQELARRLKQYRISYPMTQAELAEKSMVSLRTVVRFENGEDISFLRMIRLLKALDLEGNLEVLIPDVSQRPSYYVDKQLYQRKRVRKKEKPESVWEWGE